MDSLVEPSRGWRAARPLILVILFGSGLAVMRHIALYSDSRGAKPARTETAARSGADQPPPVTAAFPPATDGTQPSAVPTGTKPAQESSAESSAPAAKVSASTVAPQATTALSAPGGSTKATVPAAKAPVDYQRKDPSRAIAVSDGNLPGYLKDLQNKVGLPRLVVNAEGRFLATDPILFNTGLAKIREVSLAPLQKLARILREHPEIKLLIIGHTDNLGLEATNQAISADRAAAVREYLISQGIEANRLESKGMGSSKPVTSNDTQLGRQANRRIDFLVKSPK